MKAAETKISTPARVHNHINRKPYFQKVGEGGFVPNVNQLSTSAFISPSVQPSLRVSQPHDPQEIEAEAVANHIVNPYEPVQSYTFSPSSGSPTPPPIPTQSPIVESVQAFEMEGAIEAVAEEELQPKLSSHLIQRAEEMGTPLPNESFLTFSSEDESLLQARRPGITSVFRSMEEEDMNTALEVMPLAQRLPANSNRGPPVLGDAFEQYVRNRQGQGRPLQGEVLAFMEGRFGLDFSQVRIHTDSIAAQLAQLIGAYAFTFGRDIYFNAGQYSPDTLRGRHLLAHELTHVVQQGYALPLRNRGPPQAPQQVFRDGPGGFSIASFPIRNILEPIKRYIRNLPGYFLFTVLLGRDPLNSDRNNRVERNGHNIIRGLLLLLRPYGDRKYQQLQQSGQLDEAATWMDTQMAEANAIQRMVGRTISDVLANPLSLNLDRIRRRLNPIIERARRFAITIGRTLLTFLKNSVLQSLASYLRDHTQGYPLLKVVLGQDPITGEEFPRNMENVMEALLTLTEGGQQYYERMQSSGALQRSIDWMGEQINTLPTLAEIIQLFRTLWAELSWQDLFRPVTAFRRVSGQLRSPALRIFRFVRTVTPRIFEFIKDALKGWLSQQAMEIPGYTLLRVIFRRDLFTGVEVPRTTQNIIRGFMGLAPDGEAQYQQMVESGVIGSATERINQVLEETGVTAASIRRLFRALWQSFSLRDLLTPIAAFERIQTQFGVPIRNLARVVITVFLVIIELILRMMGFDIDTVIRIINNVRSSFQNIRRNPMGFLRNLFRVIKQGFTQFIQNLGQHLVNGVIGWLTGALSSIGIRAPTEFNLRSVLGMILRIFGISFDNIMLRLGHQIGHERVNRLRSMMNRLQGIWAFFRDVQERGPEAIWERIHQRITGLWDIVISGIRNFIVQRVVQRAIIWVATSFGDPSGVSAVVNTTMAVINGIQTVVDRANEIIALIGRVSDTIEATSRGDIQPGANGLENAMARTLPLLITFLANQLGLRGIGRMIPQMIRRARRRVDHAIDNILRRILRTGRRWLNRFLQTGVGRLVRRGVRAVRRGIQRARDFRDRAIERARELRDRAVEGVRDAAGRVFDTGRDLLQAGQDLFMGLLGRRTPVREGEESHTLSYREGTNGLEIMIESVPQSLIEFINTFLSRESGITQTQRNNAETARTIITEELRPKLTRLTSVTTEDSRRRIRRDIIEIERRIARRLRRIWREGSGDFGGLVNTYRLEGMVARYRELPGHQDRQFHRDHIPQNAIYSWGRTLTYFQGPNGQAIGNIAFRRSSNALAILLHTNRHRAGRTFARSLEGLPEGDFVRIIRQREADLNLGTNNGRATARRRFVSAIRHQINLDVNSMSAVVGRSWRDRTIWGDIWSIPIPDERKETEIRRIRANVRTGLQLIRSQDLSALAE